MFRVTIVFHDEAWVLDAGLAAHALQVAFPALAVGRIGEHEVEFAGRKGVGGESGAVLHVVGLDALSLQNEVGLADGVGLRIHLLAVEVDGYLLATLSGKLIHRLFRHRQHPSRAAGAVIDQVGAGLDLIGNRQEDEASHELHHVARGEVLPGLLVVLLVEAADELLEDGAHTVVVQTHQSPRAVRVQDRPGAEVDRAIQEFLQQKAQCVRFHQGWDLVAELELVQNLLDVGREPIQIGLEVGPQLLLSPTGCEVAEPEGRGVVERLGGGLAQRTVLICFASVVQLCLHVEHSVLGRFQDCVEAADDRHGQNDVTVLAAHVDVPQDIVGYTPNEAADVQSIHLCFSRFLADGSL